MSSASMGRELRPLEADTVSCLANRMTRHVATGVPTSSGRTIAIQLHRKDTRLTSSPASTRSYSEKQEDGT